MLQTRIIPILLLQDGCLVKTRCFKNPQYIGDPCNTARIFNELCVDELILLDITATKLDKNPDFEILSEMASECFMPLAYGGGIKNFDTAKRILDIGFEKISLNTELNNNMRLLSSLARHYGSQAIIASIDVRIDWLGKPKVWVASGKKNTKIDPVTWAKTLENEGAGELLLTSIKREGTWAGLELELIRSVSDAVKIPTIAHGGCGTVEHVCEAIESGASSVGVGSMFVYQKKEMGVLVNIPDFSQLKGRCL